MAIQFYAKPSEYPTIMKRFDFIMKVLIRKGEVKKEKAKAGSETFRYMVNKTYFALKNEEIENKVNNSKKGG